MNNGVILTQRFPKKNAIFLKLLWSNQRKPLRLAGLSNILRCEISWKNLGNGWKTMEKYWKNLEIFSI